VLIYFLLVIKEEITNQLVLLDSKEINGALTQFQNYSHYYISEKSVHFLPHRTYKNSTTLNKQNFSESSDFTATQTLKMAMAMLLAQSWITNV